MHSSSHPGGVPSSFFHFRHGPQPHQTAAADRGPRRRHCRRGSQDGSRRRRSSASSSTWRRRGGCARGDVRGRSGLPWASGSQGGQGIRVRPGCGRSRVRLLPRDVPHPCPPTLARASEQGSERGVEQVQPGLEAAAGQPGPACTRHRRSAPRRSRKPAVRYPLLYSGASVVGLNGGHVHGRRCCLVCVRPPRHAHSPSL